MSENNFGEISESILHQCKCKYNFACLVAWDYKRHSYEMTKDGECYMKLWQDMCELLSNAIKN